MNLRDRLLCASRPRVNGLPDQLGAPDHFYVRRDSRSANGLVNISLVYIKSVLYHAGSLGDRAWVTVAYFSYLRAYRVDE